MKSGVYVIEHGPTGKLYIGSSQDIAARLRGHLSLLNAGKHHSIYLQRTWNRCGRSAFAFHVLEYVPVELLLPQEQFWLDELKPVYNTCRIAGSTRGRVLSPEHIAKTAKANTGKKRSAEVCAGISRLHKGKVLSAETRAKIGARKIGVPLSAEHIAKCVAARAGYKASDKTKALMSLKSKGHKRHTPEQKKMISKLHTGNTYCVGRILSEATKAKQAEGQRKHQEKVRAVKLTKLNWIFEF